MRANVATWSFCLLLSAGVCSAQGNPQQIEMQQGKAKANTPDYTQLNCSGFFTDERVPDELRIVSGEQSNYKLTWGRGDYVHINRGTSQGVKEGDVFTVVREERDPTHVPWFKWQSKLVKAMGTPFTDLGQVTVVKAMDKVSVAQVSFSCGTPMQRGDIIRPYAERAAMQFKPKAPFDHFAPVSGKSVAMVVAAKDFAQTVGQNDTAFVNLGASQGVKAGDYFRIFRYQGTRSETVPLERDYQYKLYGFGSSPQRYNWNDLPREVLGEGFVLNVSRNSSTVLITFSSSEIYAGDYVELE